MPLDWPSMLPSLLAVGFGWLLNELSARLRARGDTRRKLGEAIATLLALRYTMCLMRATTESCKNQVRDVAVFEVLRRKLLKVQPHFFQDGKSNDAMLDEAVKTISGVDPVAGYNLHSVVGNFKITMRSNLSDSTGTVDAYVAGLTALEVAQICHLKSLESIIRRSALRMGPWTWVSVAIQCRREDKNAKAMAAKSDEMMSPIFELMVADARSAVKRPAKEEAAVG